MAITEKGRAALKGESTPRLLKPAEKKKTRVSKPISESWEGVDAGLFEELRTFRKQEAREKGIPPFVVFGDATLRELARIRPSTPKILMTVKGIGAKKRQQYGRAVLTIIKQYCEKNVMDLDIGIETASAQPKPVTSRFDAKEKAFELFTKKRPIQEIAATINRAESTTIQYLIDYIRAKGVSDSSPWVEKKMNRKIQQAIQ
ncbi:MAG: HRDC domain-containing protein, partial [Planctomycetota bacterium]